MKDYNWYYYHLRLTLDATNDEIEAAFAEEMRDVGTYPAHKQKERAIVLNQAYQTLIDPHKRRAYHEERVEDSWITEGDRRILKASKLWPIDYTPRRHGPKPDSMEGRSFFKSLFG